MPRPEALAAFEPEPEPEELATPEPFAGLEKVTLRELVAELDLVADELADDPSVRSDYEALVASHGLADSDALYRDYVRVRLAFESTRDGGLWHLRWAITNEKPNSEQIWRQWKRAPVPDVAALPSEVSVPTAEAECDELSALFAFLAYQLGVRHVGLYWPTWNHVVAVWTVQSGEGAPVRIVVPTSQIFLTLDDSLGTRGFDPWSQKTIYEYRRRDVKGSHPIEAELARFFVSQARKYGGLPQAELQRLRNERDLSMTAALAKGDAN
ncbi:hypothetical protein [Paraliomyxa miuraensis]|uniref:hypothetical protein n=1 Tax=Paraliomyxa miuraensis TaxID=376150 RepID=UPI00225A9A9C|nr:hypothetical protein [Paraliomyxa miuraensis]MCX4242614.1 hypothetical protein [Paraliomyxa miuraensis]